MVELRSTTVKPTRVGPFSGYPVTDIIPDTAFDGVTTTRARWPIHILTGAGGGFIHRTALPAPPKPFEAKTVVGTHCFSLLDIHDDRIDFRQVDDRGATVDAFTLTR